VIRDGMNTPRIDDDDGRRRRTTDDDFDDFDLDDEKG
jgi:hypothetical protein